MATESKESNERLFELIDAVVDDVASADEVTQLEELLRANPEARKQYLRYAKPAFITALSVFLHPRASMSRPFDAQNERFPRA